MRKLKFNAEQVRRASTVLSRIDIKQSLTDIDFHDIVDIIIYVVQKPCELRTHADVQMLKQATRSLPFFSELGSEILHETCCKSLQYQFVLKDKFIFKEGDKADKFYFIISGRVQVLKDFNPNDPQASIYDNEITQMKNGETFGERGMDSESTRTATCRAIEDTHLAYLNRENYHIIVKNVKSQLRRNYFEEFANLDIFRDWRFHDIKAFYDKAFIKKCCMHSIVYSEGDPLNYVYIIKRGEFKIVKIVKSSTIDLNDMFKGDFEKILAGMSSPKTQTISEIIEARYQREKYGNMYYKERKKPVTIKYLTVGQMFGEMELLMDNYGARTHSVVSITDQAELYQIKRDAFEQILDKIPTIKQQLAYLSEQKNQNFMRQLLSYERIFNDLTEVRKDLEKNINLDFLCLGSREKQVPVVQTPKIRRRQMPSVQQMREALTERQHRMHEPKRRKRTILTMSYRTLEVPQPPDPTAFNFVGTLQK